MTALYDSLGFESQVLENFRRLQAAGYGTEPGEFRPDLATDNRGPEFFGLEGQAPLDQFDEFGGWNPIKAVSHAVSSVANVASNIPGISSAIKGPQTALAIAHGQNVAQALKSAVVPPSIQTAMNIARGQNVRQALQSEATRQLAEARAKARRVAGSAAYIPGIGTAGAAGLSALAAASEGKDLRKIAEEAAIGAVPGGQIYKEAISSAIDVARGGNVLKSLTSRGLEYARTQVPGGELGQRAFDVALNVARGGNVGKSLATEAVSYARAQIPQLPAVAQRALSAGIVDGGGQILEDVVGAAPLAKLLTNSPLVKVGMNGASIQFPAVGVPPAAAIAATTAISEAAESFVPGIAEAARQVIANTRADADAGNDAASVALGAIQQSIEARIALRNAKAQAATAMRAAMLSAPTH